MQVSGQAVAELWGRSRARQVWPCTQIYPRPQGLRARPSCLAQGTVSIRKVGLQPDFF